jgi:hypothetical protein
MQHYNHYLQRSKVSQIATLHEHAANGGVLTFLVWQTVQLGILCVPFSPQALILQHVTSINDEREEKKCDKRESKRRKRKILLFTYGLFNDVLSSSQKVN